MEKYADYVLILFVVLLYGIYDLFDISFDSIITGIILVSLLIIIIAISLFLKNKTKEKW